MRGKCEECALKSCNTFVGGARGVVSDIVFVGEAPGCLVPGQVVLGSSAETIEVATSNITARNGDTQSILKRFSRHYKGRVVTIKTYYGYKGVFTPDHQILTYKLQHCSYPGNDYGREIYGGPRISEWCKPNGCFQDRKLVHGCRYKTSPEEQWLAASLVTAGSHYLVVPKPRRPNRPFLVDVSNYYAANSIRISPKPGTELLGQLLGLYMAEGSCKDGLNFSLGSGETELAEWLIDSLSDLFPELTVAHHAYNSSGQDILVYSTALESWARDNFGGDATTKRIPQDILDAPDSIVKSFIYGWYLGDGLHLVGGYEDGIATASSKAAQQLLYLLHSLGVCARVRLEKSLSRGSFSSNEYYRVMWSKHDIAKAVPEWFRPPSTTVGRKVSYTDTNNIYVPVIEVSEEDYDGEVYNIQTPDNTYALPFVVHNSEEIIQQEFFVGRSGQLLRQVIQQAGFTSFSFNNACLCKPDTSPEGADIAACRDRLLEELQASKPQVVVAVGGAALKALTGVDGISEVQGSIMPFRLEGVGGVRLVASYHPAAVLRRPELFPEFVAAIQKAKMALSGETLVDVSPESFKVEVATEETACELLNQLSNYERISDDHETSGFSPYLDYMLCTSIAGRRQDGYPDMAAVFPWALFKEPRRFEQIKELIETKKVTYFNGMFDCQFWRQNGIDAKIGHDTMLKNYTLDERPNAGGLKVLARQKCNAPDWEAALKPYLKSRATSYGVIPKDVLYQYAGLDTCYTTVLDSLLDKEMGSDEVGVYSRILLPASNMFLETCDFGLAVDTDMLQTLGEGFEARMDEISNEMAKRVGKGLNLRSVRDCKWLIYDHLKLQGPGGTGREVLEMYPLVPEIKLLSEFRGLAKMLGTYIVGLADDIVDGRIHPNIRVNGTTTGRLSAKNPNMMGIPKEKGGIKKMFIADEGKLFAEVDGKQMELRVLGALSNDRQMIEDFSGDVDFHGRARDRMFHKGFSKKGYTHQEVLDAKTVVFGPVYGRGAESTAKMFWSAKVAAARGAGGDLDVWDDLPGWKQKEEIATAQTYIESIWGPYPTARRFMADRKKELHENGEVRSFYGRKRRWGLITREIARDAENEAMNFSVSSPSSDTNLQTMLYIYNTYPHDFIFPLFTIHDAVLCSIDENRKAEATKELEETYRTIPKKLLNTDMPFEGEVEVSKRWGGDE